MSEWLHEHKKKFLVFFSEYGVLFFSLLFIITSLISVNLIVSLATPSPLRVSFLDVGQGDAILIQTPRGKNMLIDGGATNIILSRLAEEMSYFSDTVDVMVVTHPDADHITGLIPVLEKYDIQTIVISSTEGTTKTFQDLNNHIDDERADIHEAHTGDVIDFHDGVIVKIIYPTRTYIGNKKDTNDSSVSVLITYGDKSFLLTGDLPSSREPHLISSGFLKFTKNITVYKAGHHGSKYSSGEQLLSYTKPDYAIISAGKNNMYGHPNTETLERLQKYAKETISTIDRGTITFRTDGRIVELHTTK